MDLRRRDNRALVMPEFTTRKLTIQDFCYHRAVVWGRRDHFLTSLGPVWGRRDQFWQVLASFGSFGWQFCSFGSFGDGEIKK